MSTKSLGTSTGEAAMLDRRTFLANTAGAAGALAAACVAPLSVGSIPEPAEPVRPETSHVPSVEAEDAWHVDDICGHRPRYAHSIPHAPARTSPVLWEHVDPIDHMLVA